MTNPTAFRASYADFKLVKTRGVVQVILEVPLAESDMAYQVLGGMPNPAKETWFGIAALKPESDRPVPIRKMIAEDKKLSQQAGILCSGPLFQRFLYEHGMCPVVGGIPGEQAAATAVRLICGITSRSEIVPGSSAAIKWTDLLSKFVVWRDNPDLPPQADCQGEVA